MKARVSIFVYAGAAIVGMLWFIGCASTGPAYRSSSTIASEADVDALLGLGEDSEEALSEDDVLRLLGVSQQKPAERRLTPSEESGAVAMPTPSRETPSSETRPLPQSETTLAYREPEKSTIPPSTARTREGLSFEARYEEARRAYMARDFVGAIQQFEALLMENRNHSLADNCQYWIGECYYGMGNYEQAIAAFQKVFTFPKSNKYPDAQLKIGLCYIRLNKIDRAKVELQKLIDNYPTSPYVSAAREYLARVQ